jgi:hypothetical protein
MQSDAHGQNTILILCRRDSTYEYICNGGANIMSSQVGKWAHVVVTHNGTEPSLYLNGIKRTLTYTAGGSPAYRKTYFIAGVYATATPPNARHWGRFNAAEMNGRLTELVVLNYAMSSDDVMNLYLKGQSPHLFTPEKGCIIWHKGQRAKQPGETMATPVSPPTQTGKGITVYNGTAYEGPKCLVRRRVRMF